MRFKAIYWETALIRLDRNDYCYSECNQSSGGTMGECICHLRWGFLFFLRWSHAPPAKLNNSNTWNLEVTD
ncbi:hypothetical protein V6N11_026649 [Hibiscus sabdariffa]|uniref:Uncharacterized protein n=1 Tax=Hibiscus sabdariffa TaxID=183260 RepID=A0ABR2SWA4_9ROSI